MEGASSSWAAIMESLGSLYMVPGTLHALSKSRPVSSCLLHHLPVQFSGQTAIELLWKECANGKYVKNESQHSIYLRDAYHMLSIKAEQKDRKKKTKGIKEGGKVFHMGSSLSFLLTESQDASI